jgi:Phage Terminase
MGEPPRPMTREELLAQCSPRMLAALTFKSNGPIPDRARTLGPAWVSWVQRNTRLGEGDQYGQAPVLIAEQQALLWKLGEVRSDGRRRFSFALISMGKGSGKTPGGSWIGDIDLAGPSVVCDGTRIVKDPGGQQLTGPCPKCEGGWKPDGTPHGVRRVSPDVLIMASSYDQADMILDEMRVTFDEGPLADFAVTTKGLVELRGERGHARRIPATPKKADGTKATTLLVDELHEFDTERRENAYDVASGGTAKRQDGLVVVVSTAGWNLNSLMGRIVARAKRGEFGEDELCVILEAGEGLDPSTDAGIAEGIRQANPLAARGVANVAALVKKFREMPLQRAKRYYWNQWVPTDAAWLPAGAWDACKAVDGHEIVLDPSLPTWVGADMALRRDSAAIVTVQRREDGRLQASARIWFPDGGLIDQTECDDYLRALDGGYNLQWIAADEAWWPTLATLERGTMDDPDPAKRHPPLPIFRMPQQGRNMVIAYAQTYRAIVDQVLIHDGAPDFSDQIASAAPVSGDRGWTLKKGKLHRRIDSCPALAGAIFATGLAPREVEKVFPPGFWVV